MGINYLMLYIYICIICMACLKVVSIARKWQLCGFISEFLPPTFDFLEGCMAMFFAIFPAAFGNLP